MTDRSLDADEQKHSAGEVCKKLKDGNRLAKNNVGFDFTPVRELEPDASPARSIRHVEERAEIVAGHFIPAIWMDYVQQNGKDTGDVRLINTETGERSYQIILNGCIYIDCMARGKESLYRMTSDYSRVDLVESGSAEYKQFHKNLSKIEFDGLPMSDSFKTAMPESMAESKKIAELLDGYTAFERAPAGSSRGRRQNLNSPDKASRQSEASLAPKGEA